MLFGVLLIFGTLGGLLAERVRWLPTITGFMLLGLLIGPSGMGLLGTDALLNARVLVEIALGLILFKLGTHVHPVLLLRRKALLVTSTAESLLTFFSIAALMWALGSGPMVAILAGAIAVSSSAAVLIHVTEELHARGPTINRAKVLVALNNVWSFLLFSLALPFALSQQTGWLHALGQPLYHLVGAILIGTGVAWLATRIARLTRLDEEHMRFAIVVGSVMLMLGLCDAFKVSTLFASLALGIACRWMQGRSRLARTEFGGGGNLFFIILFVFAGANLHLHDLWLNAGIALGFVAMRMGAKLLAVQLASRHSGTSARQATSMGMMLVPMAGLAIGLAQSLSTQLPELGGQIATIVLAAVAVFETIGPPLTAWAIRHAREAG